MLPDRQFAKVSSEKQSSLTPKGVAAFEHLESDGHRWKVAGRMGESQEQCLVRLARAGSSGASTGSALTAVHAIHGRFLPRCLFTYSLSGA